MKGDTPVREQLVKVRVEIGSEEQPASESFQGGDGWKALVKALAELMSAVQPQAGDVFSGEEGWAAVHVVPDKVEAGVVKGRSGAPGIFLREYVVTARLEDRLAGG